MTTAPPRPRLPDGLGFRLAATTRVCDGGRTLLVGGGGVLRLVPAAAAVVTRAPVADAGADPTAAAVARRLLDRDAAVPWWPAPPPADEDVRDVTVVVPVRDRPGPLERLLSTLPPQLPVVVVDDGSTDPGATREAAARHGATCLALTRNQGPAAARNLGLRAVRTPYVAFCDSDVTPEPGWLGTLRRHLDDPGLALVAPRVLGAPGAHGWIDRYEAARSSLDLGPDPAAVRARGRVSYVPAACVVARVASLGDGFDPTMRSGEDVDLVWRLLDEGWRVRYEPEATVRHDHRTTWRPWLARKAFYGTSAAPLAARHGDAVAPAVWAPWSLVVAGSLLAQRRWSLPVAVGTAAVTTGVLTRRLPKEEKGRAWATAARLTAEGTAATLWQTGSVLVRHHWPVTVLAATRSRRVRRAVVAAAVVEGLADHRRVRPDLDPVRYLLARRLDDAAYGAGLWWGAWRQRSVRALLPARSRHRPRNATTPPGR